MANNRTTGAYGEELAARELTKKGYQILEKNYRGIFGEIDLIARSGDTTVFIEVKYRKGTAKGLPREAVDKRKQKRIIETANQYIMERNLEDNSFRFDVAEILETEGRLLFNYIENAFWL